MRQLIYILTILLSSVFLACPGDTGGSASAGGGSVPAPGSPGSGSSVVIFDSQSAQSDANPNFKVVNSPATTVDAMPAAPTKTHFTFGGWFTAKNGGGTQFTATTTVSGNMTVYAKWNPELTVKVGSLLWKKCAEGQNNDGACNGTAKFYQACASNTISDCYVGGTLVAGPAYDACNALNSTPTGGFAGKTGWRVPTAADSAALRYCSTGYDPASQLCNSGSAIPALDSDKFPNAPAAAYWATDLLSGWWSYKFYAYSGGISAGQNSGGVGTYDPQPLDPSGLPTGWHYLRCVANDP